jgi:hypothetical protein
MIIRSLDLREGYVYQAEWRFTRPARRYDNDGQANEAVCSKYSVNPSDRSPGLLTCTCPHLYLEGFEVLRTRESPRQILEMLYTRFDEGPL